MATSSNLEITSSSSSSSSYQPSNWDVFLSFYGKDTRGNFISHLYSALDQAGILTFRDDPALEKGEEILSGLRRAIKQSKMFVVVISENYASSSWCLDELVQILTCKSRDKQVVPVFYYVDPSDVRHQKGCFGEALDYHKRRYSVDLIDQWKSALAQVAKLSGYHLKRNANENESVTIQEIVENVEGQVSTKVFHLEKYLPGIDSAVELIYEKLRMELINHVCAVGICGMGGIGKTTTAKAFYNKYSQSFDISCFIDKAKQYSQGGSPLICLLTQVLAAILKKKECKVTNVESGFRQLKQILGSKKALIVLDDLDKSSYSEFLVKLSKLLSAESRIIITTRDVNLLNQLKMEMPDVDTHMVQKLGKVDSLELFSYHAFKTSRPPVNLRELSVSFVTYAGGHPLALKVLGSSLCGRTQDDWEAKLDKVRNIPENEILQVLQLSYNELGDETLKSMFLDIAFFFVGKYEYEAVEIFQSCDFYPKSGIPILLERCLLTIEDEKFQMHDLLQEMGRKLAKNTHLFLRGNAWEDLQNQKESDKIEVLILDMTQSMEKKINSHIFEKLPQLRLLELLDVHGIEGDFKSSFYELRCIRWRNCTWTQLPSSFRPRKLVCLDMPFSSFSILWNDARPFNNLKAIDVEHSVNLKRTPHFGNSKLVEKLFFRGCEGLLKVHPSIINLTNLKVLDLDGCTLLRELPEPIWKLGKRSLELMKQWTNMGYLDLGSCSNLRRLPKQLGDMKLLKELNASHTAIEELPDSITKLKGLNVLKLSHCKKLRKLPEHIGKVQGLRSFIASCSAIEQLPDSFVGLVNLVELNLSCWENLRNLPSSIWKLKRLEVLHLELCSKLERLPEKLGKMQSLKVLNASFTTIEEVPDSIGQLSRLEELDLCFCEKLKYLPNSIWNLSSLTCLGLLGVNLAIINLPNKVNYTKLVGLSLNCDIRLGLPVILSFSSLKQLILCDEGKSSSSSEPFSLSKLYNLQNLEFYNCTSFGAPFPELPPNLTHLNLYGHVTLVNLPDLSSLKQLKNLEIVNYISLESLPPLPPHLQSLTVYDCRSLQDLQNMAMLKDLVTLSFGRYSNLQSVGLRKRFRQVRRHFKPLFKADVPKIAEWFSYKSSGDTLWFDIPPLLGDDFLGLALWVLFKSKHSSRFNISAVVTNKTNGITSHFWIPGICITGAGVYSLVKCISVDQVSIRSGDRIYISFQRKLYSRYGQVVPFEVKLEMCGAHVMEKTPITPDFPSVLNYLIDVS